MVIALLIIAIFLEPVILMLLWNWLAPSLFGIREISLCEAFGLVLVANLLFGRLRVTKNDD